MKLHKLKKLRYLKGNRFGKDFIIGDLHGCYHSLMSLLDDANFNFERDRLFGVGDLIDRGPDSIKCLSLLNEPFFHSVKGNHEDMYCQIAYGDRRWLHPEDYWDPKNGGEWSKDWYRQKSVDLKYWADRFMKLPYVIEVGGTANVSPFWIVHAELWSRDEPLMPQNLSHFLDLATTNDLSILLWSRILYNRNSFPHQNIFTGPIYCGHSPVSDPPYRCAGHINLDGGAGKYINMHKQQANLVLFCHTSGQYWIRPTNL